MGREIYRPNDLLRDGGMISNSLLRLSAPDPQEYHNVDNSGQPRVDELRSILDRWRASARYPGEASDLDSEEQDVLRSLGYM